MSPFFLSTVCILSKQLYLSNTYLYAYSNLQFYAFFSLSLQGFAKELRRLHRDRRSVRALFLLLITAIIKKLIAPFVKRKDPVSRVYLEREIERYRYRYR
jgi:hypothetical protein